MKKIAIFGLIISASTLSSQAIFADIKATEPSPTETPATAPVQQAKPTSQPSWLGIWIEAIPMALGQHLSSQLKDNQGVLVRDVTANSPASKAGIQPFDVIAKVNEQEIFTREQLTRLIRSTPAQTSVKLTLVRKGQMITQDVILEPGPEQKYASQGHRMPHGMLPPFPSHHGKGMNNMPPVFDHPFFKQRHRPFNYMPPLPPTGQQSSWSQFESIQIESTGDDKHRAKVKHKDNEGNVKEFVFEGNRNEIREQILKLDEMDDRTKQSLLQALDMNTQIQRNPFGQHPMMAPDWFNPSFPVPPGYYP